MVARKPSNLEWCMLVAVWHFAWWELLRETDSGELAKMSRTVYRFQGHLFGDWNDLLL